MTDDSGNADRGKGPQFKTDAIRSEGGLSPAEYRMLDAADQA